MIKYIPGMLYANGKYEVFGKGEPVIYIDGRKMANVSELSLLSSSNVKSVKLITTPVIVFVVSPSIKASEYERSAESRHERSSKAVLLPECADAEIVMHKSIGA